MRLTTINYSLLCKSCKSRIPKLVSTVNSSESYENHTRNQLLDIFDELFLNRKCEMCGVRGNYAVWEIWSGVRPKQIHIQLQRNGNNLGVNIWDENQKYLNTILETRGLTDPITILLYNAVNKIKSIINSTGYDTNNDIEIYIKDGVNGDTFYSIYEQYESEMQGSIVFVENNFSHSEIHNLIYWIEKTFILKDLMR